MCNELRDLAGIEINRDVYKTLKHKNRQEMTEYLTKVYFLGYNDMRKEYIKKINHSFQTGDKKTAPIDLIGLREKIGRIKGVGEKRLDEIMVVIEECLKK